MFEVALFEPRMAPNTGNIMRLVANNGCRLHLIEPLGFDLEEKKLRRAGLDYRDLANVTRHADFTAFQNAMQGRTIWAITTQGRRTHSDAAFAPGDVLLFGSETAGLSPRSTLRYPTSRSCACPCSPITAASISPTPWPSSAMRRGASKAMPVPGSPHPNI